MNYQGKAVRNPRNHSGFFSRFSPSFTLILYPAFFMALISSISLRSYAKTRVSMTSKLRKQSARNAFDTERKRNVFPRRKMPAIVTSLCNPIIRCWFAVVAHTSRLLNNLHIAVSVNRTSLCNQFYFHVYSPFILFFLCAVNSALRTMLPIYSAVWNVPFFCNFFSPFIHKRFPCKIRFAL